MKLTMLGTGSAMASACYNTCFALEDGGRTFLVDGGGGNGIFTQLERAGIPTDSIGDLFVTHKHMDHLLGALWVIRHRCQSLASGRAAGPLNVYGHHEVIGILRQMTDWMLVPEQIVFVGEPVRLIPVSNRETRQILGRDVTFFDICSPKALQFGFTLELKDGNRLTCCGDEPLWPGCESHVRGSRWLMLEAFCLYSQQEIFKPYEKHHSTVKDACLTAEAMGAENLILYHTEDKNLPSRRELYTKEGREYFSGNIHVPGDLEVLELE